MDERVNAAKGRLFNALSWLVGILAVVAIVLVFISVRAFGVIGDAREGYETSTITVAGEAERFVAPDIATVSFSIVEKADTVKKAQEMVSKKSSEAKALLAKSGIEDKDIKTTQYHISPEYEYYYEHNGKKCLQSYCGHPYQRKQTIIGYQVSEGVTIKVRDLGESGNVLSSLGGVEVQNLSQLSFLVENEDGVREEVKLEAIEDAKDKAKARAKALGVRLGDVVSFNDGGYRPHYRSDGVAEMAVSNTTFGQDKTFDVEVSPGENRITANVSVTYEIR